MKRIVAGVDFGTLSVRVSIFELESGRLADSSSSYPLHRTKDPDFAMQSHFDQMAALEIAMNTALERSGVRGDEVRALAVDTTGSSVLMLDSDLQPLSEYYLWCDHRAWREAAEITRTAHATGLEAIRWCGGSYSSEWGWSKLLHWLRHNPGLRQHFATAIENCDMLTATLCGVRDVAEITRSVCAMGHKWMWNERWGGLPSAAFLEQVDPLFTGMREKIGGVYRASNEIAGRLCPEWAERLGLQAGIPMPAGALDAHWDAIGANIRLGDVVNVIGTSTCIIATTESEQLIPGVAGIVPGSVDPGTIGIEAGLSAVGDIFEAIAVRSGTPLEQLSERIQGYCAGQSGLLRIPWDNGDRTILGNAELGGVTLGWSLVHTAQDELFAAIEGTAFQTRVILERIEEYGAPIDRVVNGGGIPQRNPVLNQVYANVLDKPVLVPRGNTTSLGPAIFAFLAAGDVPDLETAQEALCSTFDTYLPQALEVAVYQRLFPAFRAAYFSLGSAASEPVSLGKILPLLRSVAAEVRTATATKLVSVIAVQ